MDLVISVARKRLLSDGTFSDRTPLLAKYVICLLKFCLGCALVALACFVYVIQGQPAKLPW